MRASNDMPTSINIEIDELVLDGFESGERHHIADALIAELTRLFETRDKAEMLLVSDSRDVVETNPVELNANAHGAHVGAQVAQAVYSELTTTES